MRALVLDSYGAPFKLTEVVPPTPGDGQVLVRIKASGVNPLDIKIWSGEAAHAKQPLPAILGIDLAGVVDLPPINQVGSGVRIPADERSRHGTNPVYGGRNHLSSTDR